MKLSTAVIGASAAIILSASITGLAITELNSQKREIASLQSSLRTSNSKIRLNLITKIETSSSWIMKHSSRISEATAKQIAVEAFKVPNPILIISLVEVESLFIQSAVSKVGAIGLGQIMYEVHKKALAEVGINRKRDLFNIDCNIKASSFILQDTIKKSNGDLTKALHLYLGGKDSKYVARIFSNYVNLSIEIENAMPKV